ncbi:HIV1-TAT INTERACTING PROTEIN 60KDa HOMOLOG (SAS/MOZ FAMILY) [Encephalitozoon cuniculi GB-M1]|uniref:Histone acetyltransferase n=2 Tax=Encephalitozoon cuniculi TaxID=6035 RepID=Q8SR51_ENCCU|nr:NuA4 histone acetyltransferase complex catalytic subunit ESA1 [Encephalitozoon cuniculi GB-M1]AGE96275.1 hiv1-tat interacting protein 60kDa [Encephalitozoon cuniculi]KMV65217.1 MYST histone acetyltransferase [Encephalitozoon cuniculi EcunIII-L]UYI26526.1 histone acetyltransferase [Encephalitozoon cuniculi]CAD25785.1 HIV1-TAT INTERACTING PROTEIN 60KDa HOMOLOG (SAS/MOZ FAMILY) [Encephalitozoon cuniculi GB-M1]
MRLEDVCVGFKVPVRKAVDGGEEVFKAEILGKRAGKSGLEFYVHYVELNRRLDEWIDGSMIDLGDPAQIEIPKKKKTEKTKSEKSERVSEKEGEQRDEEPKLERPPQDEEFKMKNVKKIMLRNYLVDAWYFSPYPKAVAESDIVYICEFCLYYFSAVDSLVLHARQCKLRHPPGREIYRDGVLSFFECDGHIQKNYCRNLSLLSKLFLDHKSLYYDIDVFMFYVLCRLEDNGYQIVGYFSKEKMSEQGYNLACILTLPFEQRKGYGKILIDFSYLLSRRENVVSGPEKPLSDLGLLSYRAYWMEVIVEYLSKHDKASISEISRETYISEDDVIGTLCAYKMLRMEGNEFIFTYAEDQLHKALRSRSRSVNAALLKLG